MIDPRFLPLEEAREYARSLKLSSSIKWNEFCKSPDFPNNVPKRPENFYKNEGWQGYSDWLGNSHGRYLMKGKGRLSFEEARKYVRELKISGLNGWIAYCKSGKRPANIPASPHTAYRDEWKGYGDWTGTGKVRHTKFLSFKEAREYARSLNLYSSSSWDKFTKSNERPSNIPANPEMTYKKDWEGWKNWLKKSDDSFTEHLVPVETKVSSELDSAIKNLKNKYLSYEKAREYVRTLNIKGQKEWIEYVQSGKKAIDIPAQPEKYYAKTAEWTNWYDWLGTIRGKSGQGAAVRRIISRFQELEKMGNSLEEIMGKLSEEFPRQSEDKIREILLKWAKDQSDR